MKEPAVDYKELTDYIPAVSYICKWNEEATLLYISPQVEGLLGFKPPAFAEDRILWQKLLHPDDRDWVIAEAERTFRKKESFRCEYRSIARDGNVVWLHEEDRIIYDEDGQPQYTLGVMIDITEQKTLEADLKRARMDAEKAVQAKSAFLANISHEIRTPLNAVVGMADLLKDTELNDEQREYVETIFRGSETLLNLVTDILDFSKVEAGKLKLSEGTLNVAEAITSAIDLVSRDINKKGLTCTYKIDPEIPEVVMGDSARLRQVLLNLIGNAIKFTEEGTIEVQVNSAIVDDGDYELTFSVTDTGIGIEPELKEQIFEAFTQVDDSLSRRYGGTGLGLSICKGLVEMMGGRIWVESELGKGSTFFFTVVAQHTAGEELPRLVIEQPPEEEREPVKQRPMKTLLVEDNPVNQRVAEVLIKKLGHQVTIVSDGDAAVSILDKENFDIVFMDVQMPTMDGLEATRIIRHKLPEDRQPWIIAMTANAMPDDRDRCLKAGMDEYMSKPVRKVTLGRIFEEFSTSRSVQNPL